MNEKERHAIEAHEDERLETYETEEMAEPVCLHQWQLVQLCKLCGEEERISEDPFVVTLPDPRTR